MVTTASKSTCQTSRADASWTRCSRSSRIDVAPASCIRNPWRRMPAWGTAPAAMAAGAASVLASTAAEVALVLATASAPGPEPCSSA